MRKDHISKMYPGFTVMLCFGKYGGFHIRNSEGVFGICLGWAALTFYTYDLELGMDALVSKAENSGKFSAN